MIKLMLMTITFSGEIIIHAERHLNKDRRPWQSINECRAAGAAWVIRKQPTEPNATLWFRCVSQSI